jgi:hypothetical protein
MGERTKTRRNIDVPAILAVTDTLGWWEFVE